MTKTEYTAQGVDELRASLLELFEDEDGAIAQANKKQLVEFSRDNWDYIDSVINAPEEEPDVAEDETVPEETVEETSTEEEETVEESDTGSQFADVIDLDAGPNPRTDLYTGRLPG